MAVRLLVPTAPETAERYREAGWWRAETLRSGLEAVAQAEPQRRAVADNDGSCTYGQFQEGVERAIGTLRAHGLRAGEPVLLIAPNRIASVGAFAALLRAGAVTVALDRRAGPLDVSAAATAVQPRLVIAPASSHHEVGRAVPRATLVDLDTISDRGPRVDDWEEPDPSAACLVLFTSGTTSRPKGVVHHLHSFTAAVDNLARAFTWTPEDAPFLSSPLASMTGLSQAQLALRGGALVLEDRFEAGRSVDLLERHGATLLGGAPVILEHLLAEYARRRAPRSSLRTIALGGSMIPHDVVSTAVGRYGIRAVRVYGSSEAPTHTVAGLPGDGSGPIPLDEGVPLGGGEVRIGSGEAPDEVLVRGPNVFQGYLDPADNEAAFDEGWFRTGDRGEWHGPDRRLAITGRLKEVVVRKGLKVSLPEIDEALRGCPGLIEGAAFGVPDPATGERLAVAVRGEPGIDLGLTSVCCHLDRLGLARWKWPEQVDVWDRPLPRTPSGKVRRAALSGLPPGVRSERVARLDGGTR